MKLSTSLSELRGLGPARCRELAAAGFETVGDLLFHVPTRYEDRRQISRAAEARTVGEVYTLVGRLTNVQRVRSRRRRVDLVRAIFEDDSGSIPVTWFNRSYLARQAQADHSYLICGPVTARGGGVQMVNPSCESADSSVHGGRVVPVYSAVGSLGPAFLRRILARILDALDPAALVPEHLPAPLLARRGLPPIGEALVELHRPSADADVEALNDGRGGARGRLLYGEFLDLQLVLGLVRAQRVEEVKPHRYRIDDQVREVARSILPFRLTGAQRRSVKEIVDDLQRPSPMLRLLQGDVGSGKTIVAALALVVAMESGLQTAFMAPTELLAEQHFQSLSKLLAGRYSLGLLTGSAEAIDERRRQVEAGELQLAVGTHALIQESVVFDRLGLCVIDEQHRFGVAQRQALQQKGDRPDMLVMTATPIPRSLALTAYGDLELSVIDELPPGRTPIETRIVPEAERRQAYDLLASRLEAGEQAYVVFPLIEESDKVRAASIASLGDRVRRYVGRHRSEILHGKVRPEDRDRIMRAFSTGEIKVLVATTVIEVGVDVPQATVMVIESAERFGLAQLHQLRGRVGRGAAASVCIAIHGNLGEDGELRLAAFGRTTDGFELADVDLELRGPGELLGRRQSGLPGFRLANLVRDRVWLMRAREDAAGLVARWQDDDLAALRRRIEPRAGSRYRKFAGG